MIRIALADDQTLFRDMLRILLAQTPDFEVVGTAGDGDAIVQICLDTHPDVVLLDIRMPGVGGMPALAAIKSSLPDTRVIMLTTFEDDEQIRQACLQGADGFLLKEIRPEALSMAIRCAMEGLCVLHPGAMEKMTRAMSTPPPARRAEDLPEFDSVDLAVLRHLSMGRNNAEIGQAIRYSEGTVKNRISRMLELAGLKDRTQLAIFALQNGLI